MNIGGLCLQPLHQHRLRGTTGSCLSYDTFDLRVKIFGMASAAAAVAALFDGLVWHAVKDLTIY